MADSKGMRLLTLLEELPSSSGAKIQDAWEVMGTKESYTAQELMDGLAELQLDVDGAALWNVAQELAEGEEGEGDKRIPHKVANGMILLLADVSEDEKVEIGYQLLRGEEGVRKDTLVQDMWGLSRIIFFAIKHLTETTAGLSDREGVFSLHCALAEAMGKAMQDIPAEWEFLNISQFRFVVTSTIYKIVSLAVEMVISTTIPQESTMIADPGATTRIEGATKEQERAQGSGVGHITTVLAGSTSHKHLPLRENDTPALADVNLENPEQVMSDAEVYGKPPEGKSNTKLLWELASDVGLRMFCIGCGKIMFVTAILGADAAICIFLFTSGNLSLAAAIGVGVAINALLGTLAFIISIRYLKQYETPTLMKQAQGLMNALQSLAEQNVQRASPDDEDESTGIVTPRKLEEDDVEDGLVSIRDEEEIIPQNVASPSPSVTYVPKPKRDPLHKGSRQGKPVRKSWAEMISGALHQKSSQ